MKKGITVLFICVGLFVFAQSVNGDISHANELYRLSQFAQAEAIYRQVLAKDPSNTVAGFNLANALQKQQKYEEAAQLLERFAPAAKEDLKAPAFYNQGVAYTKQKELEKSIEAYKGALRNNPDDQQARENLQKALRELKQKEEQNKQQNSGGGGGMSQKQADQKLKLLQEKEQQLQQKLQNQKGQGGGGSKDW
jgi:Ca-activated chloride channel homolog